MDNIDLPDGPKTPKGVDRVARFATAFVFILIFADLFSIPLLKWAANFGLDHLFPIVSITGVIIFVYKMKG